MLQTLVSALERRFLSPPGEAPRSCATTSAEKDILLSLRPHFCDIIGSFYSHAVVKADVNLGRT